MPRSGSLVLLLAAAIATALPAHAQQSAGDLGATGGFDFGQTEDVDTGLADGAPDGAPGQDGTPGATVRPGETPQADADLPAGVATGETALPLADTRRSGPVQPFAERLRALARQGALGGGGRPDSVVFDGDTLRDRPQGIRVGSFLLYPELFTGLGWSSNQAGEANGSAGALYRIAPSLRIESDWSRHSLGINLRGSYTGYPGGSIEAQPDLGADALLRLEVGARSEIDLETSYALSTEERGTAEATGGDQDIHQIGAGVALRRQVGVLGAELRGRVDTTHYTGVDGTLSQRDRDNALFTGALRLTADTGGTLQPFAEASLLSRRFLERCTDLAVCADRDSVGYGLRAGVAFDTGGKLSGDLAVGWQSETLDDARLGRLEGVTLDGSLVWSPARLTTVTALLATTLSPSYLAGTPGSITYSGDLRIAQGFSDALTGEAGIGYSRTEYEGLTLTEQEARATTALTYALTSHVALQGRYTFRRFSSTTAGAGYSASEIEAGLRFRR